MPPDVVLCQKRMPHGTMAIKNKSAAQEAGHPFFGTPSKLREKPEHRRPSLDFTNSVLGYRGDTWLEYTAKANGVEHRCGVVGVGFRTGFAETHSKT